MKRLYLSFIIAAAERQAAMEEDAKLVSELRKSFEQHRAAMAEKMKWRPMMQQSEHQGHEKEQTTNSDGSAGAGERRPPPPPLTEEQHDNCDRNRHLA